MIPQSYWKDLFLRIPFLWDIDTQTVNDRASLLEWNWEKLTRQLMCPVTMTDEEDKSNPVAWNYKHVGLSVPSGLNNRRRIWQILEDMYPHDVGTDYGLEEEHSDEEGIETE